MAFISKDLSRKFIFACKRKVAAKAIANTCFNNLIGWIY